MLALFCSSVLLKEPDFIPRDEIIFYVFAAVRRPVLHVCLVVMNVCDISAGRRGGS